MNEAVIRKYLEVAKRAISLIEKELEGYSPQTPQTDQSVQRTKHIQDLLNISDWPEAFPVYLFEKEETSEFKKNRANSIIDYLIDDSLEGKHFLDYGCGEGWSTFEILSRGVKSSTGFDIVGHASWSNFKGVDFYTKKESLLPSHYDVIFLYDVLDHCENPELVLDHIKSLLSVQGKVYVRCHPWTSLHATHLHKVGLNKAFMHLFLKDQELKEAGFTQFFTQKLIDPLKTYKNWFKNFTIERERIVSDDVSPFFYRDCFKQLIIEEQNLSGNNIELFFENMKLQFLDFKLS